MALQKPYWKSWPYFLFKHYTMTTAIKPVLTVPEGHLEAITCLAFSHDGQYILTGSADTTAKIWNLKSQMLRTVKGYEQPV